MLLLTQPSTSSQSRYQVHETGPEACWAKRRRSTPSSRGRGSSPSKWTLDCWQHKIGTAGCCFEPAEQRRFGRPERRRGWGGRRRPTPSSMARRRPITTPLPLLGLPGPAGDPEPAAHRALVAGAARSFRAAPEQAPEVLVLAAPRRAECRLSRVQHALPEQVNLPAQLRPCMQPAKHVRA